MKTPGPPGSYESGGPTGNVIPIWKDAAADLDLVAPDIYMSHTARYLKVLDLYHRPDNLLVVPATGSGGVYARYCLSVLGHQGIGVSPFGIDSTGYTNAPLGATRVNEESMAQLALNAERREATRPRTGERSSRSWARAGSRLLNCSDAWTSNSLIKAAASSGNSCGRRKGTTRVAPFAPSASGTAIRRIGA